MMSEFPEKSEMSDMSERSDKSGLSGLAGLAGAGSARLSGTADAASARRLSGEGRETDSETDIARMIRNYEKNHKEMPSLEDILNDNLAVPDEEPDPAGGRPRTEDFIGSERPTDFGKVKRGMDFGPRKAKFSRPNRIATTEEERRWATLAHLSAILTLVLGLGSAGLLSIFSLFIPFGIYLHWRHKSEYVAFQALQAFTLQVLGTVGWLALLVVGSLAFVILSVALLITIVGALLLIVLVPLFVLLVLGSFAMPIGMLVYSIIAALQTNQGADYRLPRIGRWIDRQMYNGFLETI